MTHVLIYSNHAFSHVFSHVFRHLFLMFDMTPRRLDMTCMKRQRQSLFTFICGNIFTWSKSTGWLKLKWQQCYPPKKLKAS